MHSISLLNVIRNIIFDWKRTLYDPDTKKLIEGAVDLLEFIKARNIPMVLVGKGEEDMNDEVNRLRLREYFSEIVFAEGEKDPDVFAKYLTRPPENTLFIGDRVRSELEIGNKLGATTIWVKQGKFATELPENRNQEPDYTVDSLAECLNVVFHNPKIS